MSRYRNTFRFRTNIFTILVALASSRFLQGCPLCNTPTGQQVRAEIFGGDFWGTLMAVAAPFPVLLIGIALYHYSLPKFFKSSDDGQI